MESLLYLKVQSWGKRQESEKCGDLRSAKPRVRFPDRTGIWVLSSNTVHSCYTMTLSLSIFPLRYFSHVSSIKASFDVRSKESRR